jgi:hypothetical protein
MMIKRRAAAAGLETKIGSHSCRATGITALFEEMMGTLETLLHLRCDRTGVPNFSLCFK